MFIKITKSLIVKPKLKFFSQYLFNFSDGGGMQVPCKLKFFGQEKYVEIYKRN
jgi:hypothetical protein